MNIRILAIVFGVIVLVGLLVGGGFWYLSTQPLYRPGMVRREERLSAPLTPPEQPAEGHRWLVEPGIELAHFSVGEGRDVLIIHGGPGQPFTEPIAGLATLEGEYRFHYYDQRGSGESTRPIDRFDSRNTFRNMRQLDRTLGIGAQLADIERIRQILDEEQLILIGHSWGGFLASLYAAEFPDHVEALVLVAPANVVVMPQPDPESDLFAAVRANLPEAEQASYDAFMEEYMDFGRLFERGEQDLVNQTEEFGRYYTLALGVDMEEGARPGGWMIWAQYLSMGQRHDYRPALQEVGAPALVIHGANDLQSEAASRLYAEQLPDATFVVVEDATHVPFEEQPERFADLVADFLETAE